MHGVVMVPFTTPYKTVFLKYIHYNLRNAVLVFQVGIFIRALAGPLPVIGILCVQVDSHPETVHTVPVRSGNVLRQADVPPILVRYFSVQGARPVLWKWPPAVLSTPFTLVTMIFCPISFGHQVIVTRFFSTSLFVLPYIFSKNGSIPYPARIKVFGRRFFQLPGLILLTEHIFQIRAYPA